MKLNDLLANNKLLPFQYLQQKVGHIEVTIEPRPSYCDRGRFIVKAFGEDLDAADLFPRYYYDYNCMTTELRLFFEAKDLSNNYNEFGWEIKEL